MPSTYVTIQGDMWDTIAKRTLGWEHYWPQIMDANPEYKDVDVFAGGIKLVIPDIEREQPEELPPWKR